MPTPDIRITLEPIRKLLRHHRRDNADWLASVIARCARDAAGLRQALNPT